MYDSLTVQPMRSEVRSLGTWELERPEVFEALR